MFAMMALATAALASSALASSTGDVPCDSEPEQSCIQLWPSGKAPNDPPMPPERRAPDDGQGCGRYVQRRHRPACRL